MCAVGEVSIFVRDLYIVKAVGKNEHLGVSIFVRDLYIVKSVGKNGHLGAGKGDTYLAHN